MLKINAVDSILFEIPKKQLYMISDPDIRIKLKDFKFTSRSVNLFNANFEGNSRREYRVQYGEDVLKLYAFLNVAVIEIAIKTSVFFSVNLPDKIALLNKASGKILGKNIYTDGYNIDNSRKCAHLIEDCVKLLDLNAEEGLIIYKNGLCLAIRNLSKLSLSLITLSNIKTIIEINFPESIEEIQITRIPENLRSLVPLLMEWAISDDDERQKKIDSSNKEGLALIVSQIEPQIYAINDFLDSFGNKPLPNEAIMLGNLATLVDEIRE